MDFYDFSADDRSVWRADPITQAFIGYLGKQRDQFAQDAILSLLRSDDRYASLAAGRYAGIGTALLLAEDVK